MMETLLELEQINNTQGNQNHHLKIHLDRSDEHINLIVTANETTTHGS